MAINILLLVIMLVAALWTVMGRSLLKATIGLAVTSAALSVIIFRLNSPIAAVFELSVCTGLMTVVFVSTISLTKPLTHKDIIRLSTKRMKRFWYLPVIVIIAAIALIFVRIPKDLAISVAERAIDVRQVLWNTRQIDLFGQIIILIAGAIGVVILFEERKKDEW